MLEQLCLHQLRSLSESVGGGEPLQSSVSSYNTYRRMHLPHNLLGVTLLRFNPGFSVDKREVGVRHTHLVDLSEVQRGDGSSIRTCAPL
jgi:hypothetical protein